MQPPLAVAVLRSLCNSDSFRCTQQPGSPGCLLFGGNESLLPQSRGVYRKIAKHCRWRQPDCAGERQAIQRSGKGKHCVPAVRFRQRICTCDCAGIRIWHFRRTGLSADNRRIAVLNTAFGPVNGIFRAFTLPERFDSALTALSPRRYA